MLLGRGDDCAVLGVSGPLCVSTDLFMEDVHFRRSYFTPEDIGWKALAVNLSDLAADGARPMGFTVGLSLPPDADMALVDGLCAGMADLAAQASVPLVGGDLSRADKLHLCLTVFGQAEKTLLRGEAQPATLFSSSAGRALHAPVCCCLRSGAAPPSMSGPSPAKRICAPPRASKKVCACRALRRTGAARKAIPPAGGLGSWIFPTASPAICPGWSGRAWARTSACPCRILKSCASCVPTTRPSPVAAARRHAFLGGEDYALIGTCSPELAVHVMVANAETTMLGKVTEGGVIRVDGVPLSGGFDHFAG